MKFIYSLYFKFKNWMAFYIRLFFYFIYPNRINLFRHRIVYSKLPYINQFTICEGDGMVEIGNNCSFGYKMGGFHRGGSIELQARFRNSRIKIGNDVATNNNIMLCAANYIEIGDSTLIGQYVTIADHEAHGIDPYKRRQLGDIGQILIGKNVWLGNNVTILKNSEIGENSIVAAGAVVAGKFPANVIIGGVPAKIVKAI
jgi:carbonic anhydrase/acetyltransferase-like protein (isoleucine patch superfamily)